MENFISPLRFKKSNYVIRLFSKYQRSGLILVATEKTVTKPHGSSYSPDGTSDEKKPYLVNIYLINELPLQVNIDFLPR